MSSPSIGDRTVARPSGCRIETRLDASRSGASAARKSVETSLDAADTSVRATKTLCCLAFILSFARAETPPLTGFPFQDETLRYRVAWASGVGLGEGRMKAHRIEGGGWEFELTLEATVPGVTVQDRYLSRATADLCSVNFERESVHGAKKSHETVTFAQDSRTAHRTTSSGGGSTDYSVPACARDALTYLYFTRREMGQGRVPPAGKIVYGGPYDIRLEYPGPETLKGAVTDRLNSSVRGPSSNLGFDLLFARDPARTPVLIRVPLALGTFSLELTR
jgi:hypothetical protein